MNPYLVSIAMEFFLKGSTRPISALAIFADTKEPVVARLVEQYIKGRLAVPPTHMSEICNSSLQTFGDRIAADVSRRFHVECHAIAPGAICRIRYGIGHPFVEGGSQSNEV